MVQDRNNDAQKPSLSDGELSVLELLWELEAATPSELHLALADEGTDWAYPTVQTLLHRLAKKGYVERERQGRNQVYQATVDRADIVASEMDQVARRLCGGSRSPLLQGLLRTEGLTRKEVDELRKLLDEHSPAARRRRRT